MKLAFGGSAAHWEANLMITEKIDAAIETSYNLNASAVIARYREYVLANARRLSVR
jgi:hypothetical protein